MEQQGWQLDDKEKQEFGRVAQICLIAGMVWGSLYLGAYWLTYRFQTLEMGLDYTMVPDPYLPVIGLLLLIFFLNRKKADFLEATKPKWWLAGVLVLSMSCLSLSAAGIVREIGWRLPGIRIIENTAFWTGRNATLQRSAATWCDGDWLACSSDMRKQIDADAAGYESRFTSKLIGAYWGRYFFVESLALLAMCAVFRSLHILIMSGFLLRAKVPLVSIFNRYGAKP